MCNLRGWLLEDPQHNEKKPAFLILDGGGATELEDKHGLQLDPILWSAGAVVDNRSAIVEVHKEYIRSGCSIITTMTYQASTSGFMKALPGITEATAHAYILDLVQCAVDAVREKKAEAEVSIAVSCGSYGAFLANGAEYTGDYGSDVSSETLEAFHLKRWRLLQSVIQRHADLHFVLWFETLPNHLELEVLSSMMDRGVFGDMDCVFSLQCGDGVHIADGTAISELSLPMSADHLLGVGVNCCSPLVVGAALKAIDHRLQSEESMAHCVLIAYPNGADYEAESASWIERNGEDSQWVKNLVPTWVRTSARKCIIGGCCRTSPRHCVELCSLQESQGCT